jgi:hypothetical protein
MGFVLSNAFIGGNPAKADEHMTGVEEITTSIQEAPLAAGTQLWVRGSGFVPATEVVLLIADSFGVLTDITITADPRSDGGGSVYPLIANDDGSWATQWRLGRFSRAGVGAEGMFTLFVYDTEDNLLATAPIALCKATRAEGEAIPSFCSK